MFEENELHIAILTETWLSARHCPPRVLSDLTLGANLSLIRSDRGTRGGGVAIAFDPTKIRMTKFPYVPEKSTTELVCATGTCTLTRRKIVAISVYLPPSVSAADLQSAVQSLSDCTHQALTKFNDAIVIVGGDFNKKDVSLFRSSHSEMKPILAGATRQGESLDEIYTNMSAYIANKCIQRPLSKKNGVESDHSIIAAALKLPRHQKSKATSFTFRPITTEGVEKFRSLIVPFDCETIRGNSPSESAVMLDATLQKFVEECFPLKKRTVRTTDAPWMDRRTKKCLNKKRCIYKKEGKSQNYVNYSKFCETVVKAAKNKFLDGVI